MESELGRGSTFTATMPDALPTRPPGLTVELEDMHIESGLAPVLIVDDETEQRLMYEKYLQGSAYQPLCVAHPAGRAQVRGGIRPQAIILDILLRGEDSWRWLTELKKDPATSSIPVLVATSVEDERKGLALGADGYCLKPLSRVSLLEKLDSVTGRRVLIIDDDPTSRYLLQKLFAESTHLRHRGCRTAAADCWPHGAAVRR